MALAPRRATLAILSLVFACSGGGGNGGITPPPPGAVDFVVTVGSERLVMRVTDTAVVRQARERIRGDNIRFPSGPLRRGDGGFNQPWHWHFDPDRVQMVESAIEVCDALPSYVESHIDDFLMGYCPWGGSVVSER